MLRLSLSPMTELTVRKDSSVPSETCDSLRVFDFEHALYIWYTVFLFEWNFKFCTFSSCTFVWSGQGQSRKQKIMMSSPRKADVRRGKAKTPSHKYGNSSPVEPLNKHPHAGAADEFGYYEYVHDPTILKRKRNFALLLDTDQRDGRILHAGSLLITFMLRRRCLREPNESRFSMPTVPMQRTVTKVLPFDKHGESVAMDSWRYLQKRTIPLRREISHIKDPIKVNIREFGKRFDLLWPSFMTISSTTMPISSLAVMTLMRSWRI
ncbi:hypothetical protein IV203_006141 [Nitzschia inconspicua]|uniref:Uncharacterized protein n=1 Tax=Nitzschia inconspicua TaxID=303405 RepID=A0A9K3KNJ3_9STRA|nr:hypothetical protein IV203_006141 [Nitzschia inconspicua]